MKIKSAETWILRIPFVRTSSDFADAHHDLIGVTVTADTGETGTGFGFTTDYGGGYSVKALLDELLVPRILGRPVLDNKAIWHELTNLTHRMGRGTNSFAIAAIDIALWDLRARANGHSLARELGQVRDRVRAYGSGKAGPLVTLDELVRLSADYIEDGLDGVKLRVGRTPHDDIARVAAVRAAVGSNAKIMADANELLDLSTAIWLGRQLADENVYWLEEPLLSGNVEGHARLAEAIPLPITGGEHLCSLSEFLPFVEVGALATLQPNACMVGGITEIMRIGELAAAHGLGFAPHFMTELHVHVAAALNDASYIEYFPFLDSFTEESLELDDGTVVVPDRPGHGIQFTQHTWDTYRIA